METFETLTFVVEGHVALIGLNRPEKRNAFNIKMLHELAQAYTRLEDDDQLWCGVLFAHGDHFTAGLDLAEVGPAVSSGAPLFPENTVDPLGLSGRPRDTPVICAIQGWSLTIGIELALASDINLAAEGAKFSQMEIKRGIMPFGGATMRFPQRAGWGNAMRYLLTGDTFGPEVAKELGLIQEITTKEDLLGKAQELAQKVAKQAPLGVQATMRSARMSVEQGFEAARDVLIDEARKLMESEDAAEGLMSFVERREANFKGK